MFVTNCTADSPKRTQCGLTIAIFFQGLYMEIGGPTMLDLRIYFDSNPEEIARSVSALGVGLFVGALLAGLLVDMIGTWKILLVTGAQLLATVSIISMPYVGSLSALWVMFFLLGTAAGTVNVCKNNCTKRKLYKPRFPI